MRRGHFKWDIHHSLFRCSIVNDVQQHTEKIIKIKKAKWKARPHLKCKSICIQTSSSSGRIRGQTHTEIETELQSANQVINLCDWLQSVTYSCISSTLGKSARVIYTFKSSCMSFRYSETHISHTMSSSSSVHSSRLWESIIGCGFVCATDAT